MDVPKFIAAAAVIGSLDGAITYNASSLLVSGDVSGWPASDFHVKIEDEIIHVGTRSGQTLSTLTRGALDTDDNHHPNRADVVYVKTADDFAANGNGGSQSATISSTDPGAIGAGALWIRTDPSESYAPTIQVRNETDDGWLDEAVVGSLLGLTYYDNAGNVATSFSGDENNANIFTPRSSLHLGAVKATLSDSARADILGGAASVVVDGADDQIVLTAGADASVLVDSALGQISLAAGSGIAPLFVSGSDVQSNFVLLVGTDIDAPLAADRGAIVIGASNEITDGNLSPGWCGISYDDTNGAAKLKIKAKTANGTVVHGQIALT